MGGAVGELGKWLRRHSGVWPLNLALGLLSLALGLSYILSTGSRTKGVLYLFVAAVWLGLMPLAYRRGKDDRVSEVPRDTSQS